MDKSECFSYLLPNVYLVVASAEIEANQFDDRLGYHSFEKFHCLWFWVALGFFFCCVMVETVVETLVSKLEIVITMDVSVPVVVEIGISRKIVIAV